MEKNEGLAALLKMWRTHQVREEDARLSLLTDDGREVSFGPNVSSQRVAQENKAHKSQMATSRAETLADAFSNFNAQMEGETAGFINPGAGTSGWTVGQGIDIAHTSRRDAIDLGMPAQLIDIADKYKAWGKKGKKVPRTVQKMEVDKNSPEWNTFRRNIASKQLPLMEKISKTNPNLSSRAVVALAQMDHWSGGIYSNTRRASKLNRAEVALATDGKKTSSTQGLMNPIELLLDSGNATDEGLTEVIGLIEDSYGTGRPLNSTTMKRYNKFLTTGRP